MNNIIGKRVVDFRFSNPCLVKSKNETHQILICDTSKEPPGLTDHKSEDKIKFLKINWEAFFEGK